MGREAEREGDGWFVTYTGRRFWPFSPHPADVDVLDVAHALSMVCRFGGHCAKFYSVAQHSVLVSQLVVPGLALEALMHDAAEAYVGDVIRPVKRRLPGFAAIEDGVLSAVWQRFRLHHLTNQDWASIKRADCVALVTERRDLIAPHVWKWNEDELGVEAAAGRIAPLGSAEAMQQFLDRFAQLSLVRQGVES